MPGPDAAPVPGVIPAGAHIHHWRLGFKQSSLGHIARVLRHPALNASRRPPLSWHALVPFGFPIQVSQATQEHSSEFLPTESGIQRGASRRTPCMRFSRTRLKQASRAARADLLPRRLEDPLPQPPYVLLAGMPVNGVPLQHAPGSVHRHRRLTCPSGSSGLSCLASTAHLPTSARFRARAPGPVSGRLYAATGGGADRAATLSRCLSAAGIRLLGILSRPGIAPLSRSAYRATSGADPDRVSMFRTHETQLGWAPSIPRGRRCSHDRPEVGGRRLPLPSGQPLSPRSCHPPRGARINGTSSGFTGIRPPSLPLTCGPGTEPAPSGFPRKLRTPAGRTRRRTSRAETGPEH